MSKDLVYSGFALSILIIMIVGYFVLSTFLKISQLYKFKKQQVAIYQNKLSLWILIGLVITTFLLFIATLVIFALFVIEPLDGYIIAFETIFLIEMIAAVAYMWLSFLWNTSIILVNKNNTLATIDAYVKKEDITSIKTDKKRRYYLINYRDDKIKGNIKLLKVKYHWTLKDFLYNNKYINEGVKKNG